MYEEIIKGLQIFSALEPDIEYGVDADHDIIWAGHVFTNDDGEANPPEDLRDKLETIGWHFDDDVNRFAYFV